MEANKTSSIYYLVNRAIKNGALIKPSVCENCGKKDCRLEGHHEDYSMPLEVVWLCYTCHRKLHKIKKGPYYRRKNKNTMFQNSIGSISSYISKETDKKIIQCAKKEGVTKSAWVRALVIRELKKIDKEESN